jgi:NADPH:quinone reductase-like Zn-dependent oxidoreductase/carotenoid cleavage dioxygenase-like enzyme
MPRSANTEPVADETNITNLRVAGQLPAALTGQYMRIGPNRVDAQGHLADLASGKAMVHAVTLEAGRATSYRNRWITTDAGTQPLAVEPTSDPRTVYDEVAAANLITFGTSILAFSDGALAYELDVRRDTIRPVDLAGARRRLVADPQVDSHTGELHLLTSASHQPQLHVTVSRGALRRTIRSIDNPPSTIRQLEFTFDDVVLMGQGFVGVAARAGTDIKPTWFAIDTEERHIACAYRRAETVVVYATGPSLVRWTLDRRASTVEPEVLDATPHRFATTNRWRAGLPQRFLWTVSAGAAHKHDLFTGEHRSHDFTDGRTPAELVYVADQNRSSTEDGGWLVGFVHDNAHDQAELVVLDAENIERPATATVHIPRAVPCGGRGTWIAAHESKGADLWPLAKTPDQSIAPPSAGGDSRVAQASAALGSAHVHKRKSNIMTGATADASNEGNSAVRMMTAIVQEKYGPSPEDLLRVAEVARPAIGDNEVLVRVSASSVDRGTWHVMSGLPYPIRLAGFGLRRPKALNPGRSVAGVVEAVGADAHGFRPGDEVFGISEGGAFAEYVAVRASKLTRKPTNLTYEQAAAVPISALTALQAIRDEAKLVPGQAMLIIGASGGVGTFAVQIAKAYGADVTGVCSPSKVDLVRSIGADHVIDYTVEDIADSERRYDVILDIGGNRRLSDLRQALTHTGQLVIIGGETDGRWLGGTDRQIRAILLSKLVSQKLGTFISSENAADLEALRELIEAGKVTPVIDRTFPMSETAEAIRYIKDGHARGKVVIAIPTPHV